MSQQKATRKKTKKKVRVMATGVFDILHTGHLFFLMEAKKLGDELVVVVARDITAKKRKREPIVPEHLRLEMIKGLKPVDLAVLGDTSDYYRIVEVLKPNIIVLGYDQDHNADKIRAELSRRGLKVEVIRLPILKHDILATTRIIERIANRFPLDGVAEAEESWSQNEGVKGKPKKKGSEEE
jgi:FAD synthetase